MPVKLRLTFNTGRKHIKGMKAAVKAGMASAMKQTADAAISEILKPASEGGLPTFTGYMRGRFDKIARLLGRKDAGPFIPHPFNNDPDKKDYYKKFKTKLAEGKADPIEMEGSFRAEAFMRFAFSIDTDYFIKNDNTVQFYPHGQLDTPWSLLVNARIAAKSFLERHGHDIMQHRFNKAKIRGAVLGANAAKAEYDQGEDEEVDAPF